MTIKRGTRRCANYEITLAPITSLARLSLVPGGSNKYTSSFNYRTNRPCLLDAYWTLFRIRDTSPRSHADAHVTALSGNQTLIESLSLIHKAGNMSSLITVLKDLRHMHCPYKYEVFLCNSECYELFSADLLINHFVLQKHDKRDITNNRMCNHYVIITRKLFHFFPYFQTL